MACWSPWVVPQTYAGDSRALATEALIAALISLLLTLANIVMIFLMALAMFRFKEVAPVPGKTRFDRLTPISLDNTHACWYL